MSIAGVPRTKHRWQHLGLAQGGPPDHDDEDEARVGAEVQVRFGETHRLLPDMFTLRPLPQQQPREQQQ